MVVALAMLAFGCSSQKQDAGNTGGTGGSVSPIDGSNDGAAAGDPVWTSASAGITLTCSSFISGVMGFQATRSQLTDLQLTLLAAMRTGPHGTSLEDVTGCSVSIFSMDASVADYQAVQADGALNDNPPLIRYATFQPFLATIPCLYSTDEGPQFAIAPDMRCMNGIFLRPSPGNADRFLTVTDPGPQRHIELDQCDSPTVAGLVHLQALAADGPDGGAGSILAEGSPPPLPGSEHTCQSLNVNFPAAGTYIMRVVIADGLLASSASNAAFRFF